MDDDVDIYGDLPSFDINECAKCKQQTNEFTQKSAKFEEEILSWKGKVELLEQEKQIILTNTSSLLKTARAEIDRKDKTIQELRRELEDVKFRRGLWSKSKTNYQRRNHQPRERKPWIETTYVKEELPTENIETPCPHDEVEICDKDVQDPEQKWDPTSQKSTLYGERLRKKLLQEQEAERTRKEARNAESKNPAPFPDQKDAGNTSMDVDAAKSQEESGAVPSGETRLPKVEEESLVAMECFVKSEQLKEELYENLSEEGELSESSDDKPKNDDLYWEEDKRKKDLNDEFVQRRRDNDHRDDSSNRSLHSNHDFRYNPAYKSRNRSGNDTRASGLSDRKHGKPDATRQTHDLRSRLNYRSRSRPERLRDRGDKYEKRREDRLTRENYESPDRGVKDNREPRERFDRKYDDKFSYESRNEHDRNYESDHKRLGQSRSLTRENYESPDRGVKDNREPREKFDRKYDDKFSYESRNDHDRNYESDHKRLGQSRSLARENYESPDRGVKDNREPREKFDRKYDDKFSHESRNDHDRNYDSDHKRLGKSRSPGGSSRSKSSSRSSQSGRHRRDRSKSRGRSTAENKSGKEKNRNDHKPKSRDRKIIDEDRVNKDSQTILPVSESSSKILVEKPKKKIPEQSKVTNSHESREKSTRASRHHDEGRQIEKSHEPLGTKFKEESKIEIHEKKKGSGDPEIGTGKRDKDLAIKTISESPKKNGGSPGNTKNLKIENFHKPPEKTIDCTEKEIASSEKIENFVDSREKFILMLENDSEIALSPIARRETDPSGSRSFREEKIENIEKFILDYKDDAIHCSLLGNDLDSSQQKEENNFANSTSSIVDTLSMDIDDLENALETKSEEKTLKTKVEVVSIPEKDENLTIVSKIEKKQTTENPPSQIFLNNKSNETAIDEESKKVIAPEISSEKTLEARVVVETKIVDVVEDKKKEIVTKKSQRQDKKSESSASSHKKSEKSTNKTQHAGGDGKSIDKKKEIDEKSSKKVQKVDGDKKLKVTESIEPSNENKESKENSDNLGTSKKLETTKIVEKTDDARIERKCEVSLAKESKNVVEISDNKNDKKAEKTADSESNDRVIDEGSKAVDKKREILQIEASDESKNLPPPLPPSPDLPVAPPLPPSPELASLPPLPPSPPPEEQQPEIACVQKVCTIKAETKKSQAEKISSKQPKNRPRIPCMSIVSLYSRKRRGMILTDSTSSRTVVTSLKSTEVLEVAKEDPVCQEAPKIGSEPVVILAKMKDTETTLKKIESEIPGSKVLEAEEKATETQFPEGRELAEPKEDNKIIAKTNDCLLEHHKPEVKSPEPVAASNVEETKPKDQSAGGSSLTEKNSVEKVVKSVDDQAKETQPEVVTTENCEKIPATCTSSKTSERAKRTVLKTIASTTGSTESSSSNRKRPLSKEKENQSKPPKQAKIMIISRRRPVQLQDSSTVTTLVPSVHEDSSKNNKTQSSQKNITASARKRRAAES